MKIRLIDPAYRHPYISHTQKVIKTIWFARLTLTSLAALTPEDIEVKITDENVEPIDFDEKVDLVGVTGMVMHANRAYQIAAEFKKRGIPVVMGGFHPTLVPEEAAEYAAVLPRIKEAFRKEFVTATGYHRKYALVLLNHPPPLQKMPRR